MSDSKKTLAHRYLDADIQAALKKLDPSKPFRTADFGLPHKTNQIAAQLKRYDLAEKTLHNHGKGGWWKLTKAGRNLWRQLNGLPPEPMPKRPALFTPRVPKYVEQIETILQSGPCSQTGMAKQLDTNPQNLKASLQYLKAKGRIRHSGQKTTSLWTLVRQAGAAQAQQEAF